MFRCNHGLLWYLYFQEINSYFIYGVTYSVLAWPKFIVLSPPLCIGGHVQMFNDGISVTFVLGYLLHGYRKRGKWKREKAGRSSCSSYLKERLVYVNSLLSEVHKLIQIHRYTSVPMPHPPASYTATEIPFMYSFPGNWAASVPFPTFMCLWAYYSIYSVHIFSFIFLEEKRQINCGNIYRVQTIN